MGVDTQRVALAVDHERHWAGRINGKTEQGQRSRRNRNTGRGWIHHCCPDVWCRPSVAASLYVVSDDALSPRCRRVADEAGSRMRRPV